MAKDRLSREDLDEFQRRSDLRSQQERALNNTEIADQFWMKVKIKQMGLDETKNYQFMRDTGKIVVIETPEENFEVKEDGTKGN